jgi:hypothetical protein
MRAPLGCLLPAPMFGGYRCCNPSVFALLLVPLVLCNRQIYEDLGVPLFDFHVRALAMSFNSKVADVENSLVRQLGRYADRGLTPSLETLAKCGRRPVEAIDRNGQVEQTNRVRRWSAVLFGYRDWFFSVFFSVVRQIPGYTMLSRGTGRTSLKARRIHISALQKSSFCDGASLGSDPRQPSNQSLFLP